MTARDRTAPALPERLSPAEGRKFAFTVGAAFLLLSGLLWWRDHGTAALVLAAVGGALGLAGLILPGRLGPVYRGWMKLALLISRVTTPIFMSIVYFLVITPTGLILRLFGRQPMRHRASSHGYWKRRDPDTRTDMRRLF